MREFEIKLPLFEGPFDLLLFFIERDELDIYDIPISKITKDFLEYIGELEKLNIEVASEFIFVASSLMRIKSKMLLPRPQIDEEGNEIDPREELIQHLLEYKKYKSVVPDLSEREESRLLLEKRGNIEKEIKKLAETTNVEAELQNVDLYKLLKVFEKVMERFELESSVEAHKIIKYPYTIEGQKEIIIEKVKANSRLSFEDVIAITPNKIGVIYNLLAILELLQAGEILLVGGLHFNDFFITSSQNHEPA
ncbi:MAG: segregation/condensation protein A [Cyclobacteriaceae bacterium]|nr:segregation/condensation protein A [Cyclobacteriaceae bacterium]MCH8517629.1 segregation/condensation protein A [Cyclobacteriaceae bacterium]